MIGRCSHYTTSAGDTQPLGPDMRATLEQAKNNYSSQGKRCILLARKVIRKEDVSNQPGTGLFEDEMFEQSKTGLTLDRKSTRLNSSHSGESRMPSSA